MNRVIQGMVLSAFAALAPACSGGASEDAEVTTDSLGRELGPITRKIVTENAKTDKDLNLLARVEVQENEVVEFYEPREGVLLVSVAGAPEVPHAQLEAFDWEKGKYADLWSTITQEAVMPEALADALARGDRTSPAGSEGQVKEPGMVQPEVAPADHGTTRRISDDVAELEQAHIYAGWCDSTYYSTPGWGDCPSFDFNVCWDHVTGNGSAWHHEIVQMRTNVCPYLGNVSLKITADESGPTTGTWTVLENTSRRNTFSDWDCDTNPFDDCPYIKSEVLNAAGDGYQFRYHVDGS